MCRNIRTLHNFEPPATDDEVHAAALQYVRKISGSTKPSQANAEAFERAVDEVARRHGAAARRARDDRAAEGPRGRGGQARGPAPPSATRPEAAAQAGRVEQEIEIRGEMIRLGQLLKLAGVVGSGSETKDLLAYETVLVNGEPEERRGRQLHAGDTVSVGEISLRVTGRPTR